MVAALREQERFRNRAVYVASYTVTVNELIELAEEIAPEKTWNVVDIPDLEVFKQQGLQLWDEDRKRGVGWLHSQAFMMLSAVSLFDENNRYGANFGEKLESRCEETGEEFKGHLKQLIEEVGK